MSTITHKLMQDQAQPLRDLIDSQSREFKIITITSGKGGVGKSSIAINLSIALRRLGLRVLVVDADFGLENIDVMLGVTSKYDLSHFLKGEKNIQDIIQEGHEGVRFISGGSGVYELLKMNEEKLRGIMSKLMCMKDPVDIILFDTGAGVNENILQLIAASSETVVVTTPEPTAILDAYALIKTVVRREASERIRIIMNKGENRREVENVTTGFLRIIEKNIGIEATSLGYVLYDGEMSKSIKRQKPIMISNPNGAAARDIEMLARRLVYMPCRPAYSSRLSELFQRWLG